MAAARWSFFPARGMSFIIKKPRLSMSQAKFAIRLSTSYATRSSFLSLSRRISSSCVLHCEKSTNQQEELKNTDLSKPAEKCPKYYVPRKFIPMTRKALLRKILEDCSLVPSEEREHFQEFSAALDKKISTKYHAEISELKALYEPLHPDKDTVSMRSYTSEERRDNEFWLLDKLSSLLNKAHFYELPTEAIHDALKEHDTSYGVLISVDPSQYDVLRVWVIGKEIEPYDFGPWYSKIFTVAYNFVRSTPKIERYKRVVVAIRHKKQQKLLLKVFKDIRCANLEHLLPEGKIRMTQFDQQVLVGMLGIGVASIAIKLITFLADYKFSWIYIATALTGIMALRAWTMYKNKRNSYLVDLSRTLYFKSIANNRASLILIADRAEDEVFKSTVIAYSFLRAAERLGQQDVTAQELKDLVDKWLNENCLVETDFEVHEPLRQLEILGLLVKEKRDDSVLLSVPPLEEALSQIPSPPLPSYVSYDDRAEELEIDVPQGSEGDDEHKAEIKENERQESILRWH